VLDSARADALEELLLIGYPSGVSDMINAYLGKWLD